MKIIALLDCPIGGGGGFDQAINASLQMQRLCRDRFDFEVLTNSEKNINLLRKLGLTAGLFKYKRVDRLLELLSNSRIFRRILTKFRICGPLERNLIINGCNLVYLVTPNSIASAFQKLNYITTLWDLCHRDYPEFPEVRAFNSFFSREQNYKDCLPQAILVLTDSEELSESVCRRYGIDTQRVLAMPYGASELMIKLKREGTFSVLTKYKLNHGYFIYPAQFWPHKNHIRILQALIILKSKYSWCPKVVFVGKDHGNLPRLISYIRDNDLGDQVVITGFVPSEDMESLYRESIAVVMPTYFGPTNLPPLEAWIFDKPLLYSSHLIAQVGSAALLIDPDSADSLADAMRQVLDPAIQNELINAGRMRILEVDQMRLDAEKKFLKILDRFSKRRECWEA